MTTTNKFNSVYQKFWARNSKQKFELFGHLPDIFTSNPRTENTASKEAAEEIKIT